MKYVLRWLIIIGCATGTSSLFGKPAEAVTLADQIIMDRIFAMIGDPETAELRPILLSQFVQQIEKDVKIERSAWGDRRDGYREVTFLIIGKAGAESKYGIEVLVKKESEVMSQCRVVNARLLYYAPSGNIYYNSVIPEPWPIEKRAQKR